ncbi:acyl-CoA dehydrogenase [Aliidongia dinghuensis]|uniref:Acyl-CoA dehydrogenase n=1 Tax=Aliidongia dinghuensis TaxID=1867774 RepID=A0A8J3E2U2_9PROT|nr:isovaleryl-CoA dehydrogenase [Aliidongia dinghuensis]GGF13146.1 acyl-CoA dehydrogenase [Aliidongia dinghuensis]
MTMAPAPFETHEVLNQPPPLVDYDLFATDRALKEAVVREGADWALNELGDFGRRLGRAETIEAGRLANAYPPVPRLFDRYGRRIDEVEFHPAWHELMALAIGEGLHTRPWAEPKPGAHVARAAGVILMVQVEAGVQCPTTMTYGVVPALKKAPALAAEWLPRLYSRQYDKRIIPAPQKTGALMGMGMTEKQGGSDLRANMTRATPLDGGGPGTAYRLDGHKWFFSAPQCDAFLVLAQAPGGLSCFFLPRFLADGSRNAVHIQRLKDKLGNKSNASSEVEFHGAIAWLVGEEGRGVPTIIEMGNYTRLDCALGSTGLMRQAVAQATHHAAHRSAFQKRLIDQPLMTNVLADLAIESEAATALVLRLARAYDRQDDPAETAFRRMLTPAAKYWICKRGPALGAEAMEVLGGNGYVEEAIMGRLYRELPLNSIWEGSGNVMCLDVLRALAKTPEALDLVLAEIRTAQGADRRLDAHVQALTDEVARDGFQESRARHLVEKLVLALQGALLIRFSDAAVADGFCASRLGSGQAGAFGTLPSGIDLRAIAERARPQI